MDRANAIKEIERLARECGIHVLLFNTEKEMTELLDDMSVGAMLKAACKGEDVTRPKGYLM